MTRFRNPNDALTHRALLRVAATPPEHKAGSLACPDCGSEDLRVPLGIRSLAAWEQKRSGTETGCNNCGRKSPTKDFVRK